MKSKNFIILLIVLAVLLGIIFVKKALKPPVPTTEPWVHIIKQMPDKDTLTACILSFGKKKIHLVKKDDRWTVEEQQGAYADEQKIDRLIQKMNALEGELRSDNKEVLPDYGITDSEGVTIGLKKDNTPVAQIVLGTLKPGWNKNFVRLKGSNAVYLVEQNILSDLGLGNKVTEENFNMDQWIDKQLLDLDLKQVKSVKLEKEGHPFIDLIQKIEDGKKIWKTTTNYPINLDSSKINTFLRTLIHTKAASIAFAEKGAFQETGWKISLGLDNDTTITLIRGKYDSNNGYLKVSDKNYLLKVADYALDKIDKTDGDFFVDNPLEIKDSDIKSIMIHDLNANKEINIKNAGANDQEGSKENLKPVWTSDEGDIYKTEDVKDVLHKLENISIITLPEKTQSVENLLIIRLTKKDGSLSEYILSKNVSLENGEECHYLTIKEDSQDYCVEKPMISSLKSAIAQLNENKPPPEVKKQEATK